MRISRQCPSWRRYLRPRFGFRTFIMTLAAIYFTAMYVFHSSLNGGSAAAEPPRDLPPERPWETSGNLPQRQRQTPRVPEQLQEAAFDNIRQLALQQQNAAGGNDRVDSLVEMVQNSPVRRSRSSDVNVPASCNASADSEQQPRVGEFLQLAGIYLLSTFWDERPNDFDNRQNGTLIRLMAVARDSARHDQFVCDFGEAAGRTAVSFYEMCENHRRPYGSFILSCRVPDSVLDAPCVVTVVDELGGTRVHVPLRTLRPRSVSRDFTVCVPPLFGDIQPARLVEFFELTFILGADQIVIYEWNTSPKTHALVQHYAARCHDNQRSCKVDVINWRLPDSVSNNIWYNGQSLAIQDCLYRQMASSRYVVFSDIDEFLLPHKPANWTELARTLKRPLSVGFQFQSAFFDPSALPLEQPPVEGEIGAAPSRSKPDLMTMRSIQRSKHFSSIRTKCMVRPYEIFEAGIHHISKPIWAHLSVERVDTEVGFVHHYRKCFDMYGMNCAGVVSDSTIQRYFDQLHRSVTDAWKQLAGIL